MYISQLTKVQSMFASYRIGNIIQQSYAQSKNGIEFNKHFDLMWWPKIRSDAV